MRDFNEADKKKKKARIQLPENPGNLTAEKLAELKEKVKASLKDGYLPCGTAFKIARELNVPKIAVGAATDRLGLRVSNCQTGCFKVDKIIHNDAGKTPDEKITVEVVKLQESEELTCANVFMLAERLKTTPMAVADAANIKNWKIRQCQLGCF